MEVLCIFIAVFSLYILLASSAEEPRHGQFTVELRGSELLVGATCKSSWSGSSTDIPCQHEPGTVSPFIQLTTCVQASSVSGEYTSGVVLSTSNTLVTHLNQQENCTTEGCHWKLGLAEVYLSSPCLDVCVNDFTTAVPPLKGIRKRIWLQRDYQTEVDFSCEGECEVLDNDTYEQTIFIALVLKEGLYYLHHTSEEANFTMELPQCLHDGDLLEWTAVYSTQCSGSHHVFTPSHIHVPSSTEAFIISNTSVLYSPCRGCMWYQFLLPSSNIITSFACINNIFYALLTTNNESGEVGIWAGITGQSLVLQVYPSSTLSWLFSTESLNSFLTSASLTINTQGNLLAVSDGDELQLPLPLLLSHSLYNHLLQLNSSVTLVSSLQLLADPNSLSLADKLHPLLNISHYSHVCILTDVHVEASVCSRITRSVVLIESRGFLQFVNHGSLPWTNCDVMYSELPRDVFLRLGERYTFTVHLLINPMIAAEVTMDQLTMVPTLSRPDTVQIVTERTLHPNNNSMTYQISLMERNISSGQTQVPPATILRSVDIVLQAGSVGIECVHPLNLHPNLIGRLQTRVHVGCPPGISLVFDDITTQSHYNQFCTPTANISCYYFGNEFRPVLQLVDFVTGESSIYTGPYTLRVLAGGASKSDMKTFESWENIETQIWTVSADDVISHTSNKIEWACGLGSPCSEIVPSNGGSPEYYLHLQASNRIVGQHETYCDLTVDFTIRLHGLSMGPISTSVTLILLLVLLVVPLMSLFLVWVWKGKRADQGGGEEEMEGQWWQKVMSTGRDIVEYLRQFLEKIVKKYQQMRPLEPHLHSD